MSENHDSNGDYKDYKSLYLALFGAMEDALELLKQDRFEEAENRLIQAQRAAENRVIERNLP